MFSIVTESQLALDGNYDRVCCLKHVGTEGIVAAAPPTATTTSPAINTAPRVAIAYARAPPVANRARLPIAIRTRCSPNERARHHLTIPFIESPFPAVSVLVEIDLGEDLVDPRVKRRHRARHRWLEVGLAK
jgi:hypothetical protein